MNFSRTCSFYDVLQFSAHIVNNGCGGGGWVSIMQCAVCSVQCVLCSVQCVVCSVQCAVYSVQCAVCSVKRVVWSLQCGSLAPGVAMCQDCRWLRRRERVAVTPAVKISSLSWGNGGMAFYHGFLLERHSHGPWATRRGSNSHLTKQTRSEMVRNKLLFSWLFVAVCS